ncbi:MAG TPA: SLC13 family permease [Verrucomicrobiales bacterium]|nr:SLC13 family permease [Verrucomicrobiales bacterium]HIL68466.1 SLC13 family permease [Verrucomicrobiota bacterium]
MTWPMIFILVVLLLTFVAMVSEKMPIDTIAMTAFCVVLCSGMLSVDEALSVFSNEAPIVVACMFILSASLERTGIIRRIGQYVDRIGGNSERSLLLILLPSTALLSSIVNNTPVVVVLMPLVISLAHRRGISPSKLLIPLSFAAIFGGSCTLIGTSTNMVVSATASKMGYEPLSMFELTPLGIVLAGVGILYLIVVGSRLLPERSILTSILNEQETKEFLTEAVILPDSPVIGKRLFETDVSSLRRARILNVIREGEDLSIPLNEIVLEQGDRIRLMTVLPTMMEIKALKGLDIIPRADIGADTYGLEKATMVEAVISFNSELNGKTIAEVNFRQRFGVVILAIHRRGVNLRGKFANFRLRFGDILLLEGANSAMGKLREDRSFLLLEDVGKRIPRKSKQWVAVAALFSLVIFSSLNILPVPHLAIIASMAVVLGGCLEPEEAYRAINWKIIFLIIGTLGIAEALRHSLVIEFLISNSTQSIQHFGETMVLSVFFFCTSLLSIFMPNNAVAGIMTPVAVTLATTLGVEPRAFLIAAALAASASFASPISYQTNTLVYGVGGYKFRDFVKVGLPLNILFWLLASLLIPWLYFH